MIGTKGVNNSKISFDFFLCGNFGRFVNKKGASINDNRYGKEVNHKIVIDNSKKSLIGKMTSLTGNLTITFEPTEDKRGLILKQRLFKGKN